MEWFLRGAEMGNADAMFNAGVYYCVKKNEELAQAWYDRAKDAGCAP